MTAVMWARSQFGDNDRMKATSQTWKKTLAGARREGRLVWYTGPNPVTPVLAQAFRGKYPWLRLEIVALDGPVISERFYEDKDARRESADVLCVGSGQSLVDFKKRGYLAPLADLPNWDDIPDWSKDAGGFFYHYINSRFGIMYNTHMVSDRQAPRSYAELVEPRWKGLVALIHPSSRGMGLRFFQFAASHPSLGWKWIAKLRRVEPLVLYMAGGPLTTLVIEGGRPVAPHRDLEAVFVARDHPHVRFRSVSEGRLIQFIPLAVNARARNPNAARVFADWVMSRPARRLLESYGYGYPIRRDSKGPAADRQAHIQTIESFPIAESRVLAARAAKLLRTGEYEPTIPPRIRF
jgi:iron(III) transport system substrate-binding protein